MTLGVSQENRPNFCQHKIFATISDFDWRAMATIMEAEAAKRVTFYEKVTVVHFSSMNRALRKELFYRRSDIEQFQMDAYVESILLQRSQRRQAEQARCNGIMCQDQQWQKNQNTSSVNSLSLDNGLCRPGTAIAA